MAFSEIESLIFAAVAAGPLDPDTAVAASCDHLGIAADDARNAIVNLVDRHELTFTNECLLARDGSCGSDIDNGRRANT